MYQNKPNAIQRARISKGLTQEALAGRCGYSDDTIRAWESGALDSLLPDFRVALPLAEAAAGYISAVLELVDSRFDRQLLRMVADGHIDEVEGKDFAALMEVANRVNRAYYEMRFAAGIVQAGGDVC